MSAGELREVADEVRQIAREEARRSSPPVERFRVRRRKPLRLEAFASELQLEEDDDDLRIGRGLRQALRVGDTVYVAQERDGDYVVLAATAAKPASDGSDEGVDWFAGEGKPDDDLGNNGDFYLRLSNKDVYRKKDDEWVVVGNWESGGGKVQSVFGRVGEVVAKSGDYSVGQITGAASQANLEAEAGTRAAADVALGEAISDEETARLAVQLGDGLGLIAHGAAGGTARGTDFAHYIWVGEAEPENAIEDDIWLKP